jgi:hypothetical protein
MRKLVLAVTAVFVCALTAFSQSIVPAPNDAYQVRYAANLTAGDSVINLTNTGVNGGFDTTPGANICANVYVFAEDQQLIACCSCPLTPNHLRTLSVRNDLINNTLTPGVPTAVTIALLASSPGPGGQVVFNGTCDASTVTLPTQLVSGLRAWGTTIHAAPNGQFQVTETKFANSPLGTEEFFKLHTYCGFIKANGSGFGICGSCRDGAAGAARM